LPATSCTISGIFWPTRIFASRLSTVVMRGFEMMFALFSLASALQLGLEVAEMLEQSDRQAAGGLGTPVFTPLPSTSWPVVLMVGFNGIGLPWPSTKNCDLTTPWFRRCPSTG